MTMPLPDDPTARDRPPRSDADRERARVRVARKWAYLVSMTSYVPLEHTELERPLRGMVDTVFAAVASEPLGLDEADEVGGRLVRMQCADRASLRCTVDVLAGALLSDEDLRCLPDLPERVARVLGALASGFTEGVRRRTLEQQETMCRALLEIARKSMRTMEAREAELDAMRTEMSLLQRQLGHQLLHDALTGLPNRQFFTTRLEEVLHSGKPTTVYRLELNGFSILHDGLGGPSTDSLLTAAAVRIRAAVADEHAMVARFDGASFAILQENVSDPAEVVAKIGEMLAEPIYIADAGLATTVSVGVVRSPPHRSNPVELLHAADMALRYARRKGPGQWVLLDPDEDAADRRRLRLAASMPGAWETGKLWIGYRLRVRLVDGTPAAVEAVTRWDDADRLGGPRCAELAEETGLNRQLGGWLLRAAGAELRSWSRRSGADLPLAVALSPHQSAAPDLVDEVVGVLAEIALPARRLELAMPAGEVFDGRPQAVANLAALAGAGVRTAVRDFGGGSGDLVRLADLPVTSVWLAPRLVAAARRCATDSLAARAVRGVVTMAHLAGVTVAVDGVRSTGEANWWRGAKADTAAGPAFSAVHEPSDLADLFA